MVSGRMAYTVAHIKFDMVLAHTGYKTEKTMMPHLPYRFSQKAKQNRRNNTGYWIFRTKREADRIKSQRPIMVMLGNPPYNGESQNKADEIEELIEKYKQNDQILNKKKRQRRFSTRNG